MIPSIVAYAGPGYARHGGGIVAVCGVACRRVVGLERQEGVRDEHHSRRI
jgi:hypothetical protein